MCCQNTLIASPTHNLEEGEGEALHHVIWDNLVNVSVIGTTVSKIGENGWNAGMFSVNKLSEGQFGTIEHRIAEPEMEYFFGLSREDANQSYQSIDYAWFVNREGAFIYLRGKYIEFMNARAGDVLQIEKMEGTIFFKKNNVPVAEFPMEEETALHVDVSIKELGTFEFEVKATFEAQFSVNRWRTLTGVTYSEGIFTKDGALAWDAGFFSEGKITKGKDGFIEHQVMNQSRRYMVGLSDEDVDASYKTIDFAWFVKPGNAVIYKNGKYQTSLGSSVGDVLRIEKIGNTINMLKNNIVIRSYEADPDVDYHIDASLRHGNGSTYNIPLKASFPNPSTSYVILKKKLDGGRAIVTGDLKFKFIQEYAVSSTAKINYKVYNWQRNAVLNSNLSLQYGVNWFTVPTNALNNGETYILELEGNKEQKYYIKFKYQENQPWEEELEEEPSEQ
jgi:hypothetical protein